MVDIGDDMATVFHEVWIRIELNDNKNVRGENFPGSTMTWKIARE